MIAQATKRRKKKVHLPQLPDRRYLRLKNRRQWMATIFGSGIRQFDKLQQLGPSEKGIDPYTGPWTYQEAGHLLRRTTFGPTHQMIKDAVTNGLDATIDQLFAPQPQPPEPVNPYFDNDPQVPVGESWVDKAWTAGVEDEIYMYRHESLRSWLTGLVLDEGVSIREKMTLFWHNHFVVADIDEPTALYRYIKLLRSHATGNFKQLTKDITIDPSMLYYLNGNENIADEPNENFARELLELFTIGKGPQAGPGDYTNYTEQDVVALAKVFTGWHIENEFSFDPNYVLGVSFSPDDHDNSTKQLSARFNNATIPPNGSEEYKDAIDIIFQQPEVARFIVRKLYRWFVYYDITATTEMNVIEPLAQMLIANNYEIAPVLKTLLKSEHFFDTLSMGCMIKSPADFIYSAVKQFDLIRPVQMKDIHYWNLEIFYITAYIGQEILSPPSVSGWKAYYQAPGYYRWWLNSVNLTVRGQITAGVIFGYMVDNLLFKTVVLDYLQAVVDNPADPNAVVNDFAKALLPMPLTQSQKDFLKSILIPGLPDFEWTVEYNNYLNNPGDPAIVMSLEEKIQNLLYFITILPEYHLS